MRDPLNPNRRYPPSPYPPRSKANAAYRDGWDKVIERGLKAAFKWWWYEDGYWLNVEPDRHGFEDGAKATIKKQIRDLEGARQLAAEQRAELAAAKAKRRGISK